MKVVQSVETFQSDQRQSEFFRLSDLKGKSVPERQWLVPDWIPMSQVTLLYGDGGTGKSLLALQLAVSVATGCSWLERPIRDGCAIYLSAEDEKDELHIRCDDILRSYAKTYSDAVGLSLRSLAGEDALLAVESQAKLSESELFQELVAIADDEAPELIVIDTAADVFPANENDRAKVRQFIGILRGLAIRKRCAVVLLCHPSVAGMNTGSGTSGSTAWSNSARSRLYLTRVKGETGQEADADKRILENMKLNYAQKGSQIGVRWYDGVFVAQKGETGLDRRAQDAKVERVFLTLLDTFATQGRKVNPSSGSTYAPKVFAEHPDSEGIQKPAFRKAMERLLKAEKIAVEIEGSPSKRRSFLVRTET